MSNHYNLNKQKYLDKAKKWAEDNPERKRQINRKYYHKNKEKYLERNRQTRRTTSYRFSIGKRNAKKRNLVWQLTLEEYENIIDSNCYYCNGELEPTGCGLDRVDSSIGYTVDNVIPCCKNCNQIKSNILSKEETTQVINLLKKLRTTKNLWGINRA